MPPYAGQLRPCVEELTELLQRRLPLAGLRPRSTPTSAGKRDVTRGDGLAASSCPLGRIERVKFEARVQAVDELVPTSPSKPRKAAMFHRHAMARAPAAGLDRLSVGDRRPSFLPSWMRILGRRSRTSVDVRMASERVELDGACIFVRFVDDVDEAKRRVISGRAARAPDREIDVRRHLPATLGPHRRSWRTPPSPRWGAGAHVDGGLSDLGEEAARVEMTIGKLMGRRERDAGTTVSGSNRAGARRSSAWNGTCIRGNLRTTWLDGAGGYATTFDADDSYLDASGFCSINKEVAATPTCRGSWWHLREAETRRQRHAGGYSCDARRPARLPAASTDDVSVLVLYASDRVKLLRDEAMQALVGLVYEAGEELSAPTEPHRLHRGNDERHG